MLLLRPLRTVPVLVNLVVFLLLFDSRENLDVNVVIQRRRRLAS